MFLLIPSLLAAGASGVSLLGTRTDSLALTRQKRGPIAFMTGVFVLLPCSYVLSTWASAGSPGGWFYAVHAVERVAGGVCMLMIGRNIRDGLVLTGRIAAGGPIGSAPKPTIDERDGGPLIANAVPRITGSDGVALNKRPVAALCRCGASKTKPHCDGSHAETGLDSHPSDDRTKDEVLIYEGKGIKVHYDRSLCSHAAECGKREKAAFDSSRKP